jgi:hypothetical protein
VVSSINSKCAREHTLTETLEEQRIHAAYAMKRIHAVNVNVNMKRTRTQMTASSERLSTYDL